MKTNYFLLLIGILVLFTCLPKISHGTDYCVYPGGTGLNDFQNALNDAAGNMLDDTIQVVQGYYSGTFTYGSSEGCNLNLLGGYIPGTGCGGRAVDPTNTVIDGQGSGRCFCLINYDNGGNFFIEGFTLKNGQSSISGGGLYSNSSTSSGTAGNITITTNIIRKSISGQDGGGVYAYSQASSGSGGDISFTNNTVADNNSEDDAGGIFTGSYGTDAAGAVTFTNNTISGNTAKNGNAGGVIATSYSSSSGTAGDVIFVNNMITNNLAYNVGGGAYVQSGSDLGMAGTVTLTNNTISENRVNTLGGGLFVNMDSNIIQVCNNIIRGNIAPSGADIRLSGSGITYGYYNNYASLSGSWDYGTSTNINIDPKFIDPDNGDFRLRSTSSCKDAGTNGAPSIPSDDFEGDTRIIDSLVDIGADEVSIVTTCASLSGETTLQDALAFAQTNGKGDVIMVQQGTHARTGNFLYTSSEGCSITLLGGYRTECAGRTLSPSNTVLNGQDSGRVLQLYNSDGGNITVEGLTFQNGNSAGVGAGLYAYSYSESDPSGNITLANNIIKDNTDTDSGGGVYARSQSSESPAGNVNLTNNIIIRNTSGGFGGGALAYSRSISDQAGDVTLTNNVIADNTANENSGGGVYASSTSDSSSISGGTVTLTNNTITGNTAVTSGGGGFYTYRDANTTNVYNNIIWGNTAASGGNDIYLGNTGNAYGYNNNYNPSGMVGSWTSSGNNINTNPLLRSSYHLKSRSPCIDTGTNDAPRLPFYDFDGYDRILDGNRDELATVDIGADEYIPKGLISHIFIMLLN